MKSAHKYLSLIIYVLIGVIGGSVADDCMAESSQQPNIVLIMADDMGYECVGSYGSESYETPVLDGLAESGIRFDHCYSQPLCTPSRVQLMTGRYNFRNYRMFGFLDIEEITFGHLLKKAGYQTCIAGKWQLGSGVIGPNLAGFDEYALWHIYRKLANKWVLGPRYADPKIYVNGNVMANTQGKYGPDIVCNFILDFIERKQDQPFFVYYPMILPHNPFVPTPDSPDWSHDRNRRDNKYFADMISYVDKNVGRIVVKLEELELRENTVVMFIGDNGTNRDIRSRANGRCIQGGKNRMTDAGTHVPFIANWPGAIPAGRVCDDLVDFSDFLPTLMEIANVDLPEDVIFDGRSFLPQLKGQTGHPRDWIFMHYWGRGRDPLTARNLARDKVWKLYDDGSFFNLAQDPLEQNNLTDISGIPEAIKARKKLQAVLENIE